MRKLAAFMALMMIAMACLNTAFVEERDSVRYTGGDRQWKEGQLR